MIFMHSSHIFLLFLCILSCQILTSDAEREAALAEAARRQAAFEEELSPLSPGCQANMWPREFPIYTVCKLTNGW